MIHLLRLAVGFVTMLLISAVVIAVVLFEAAQVAIAVLLIVCFFAGLSYALGTELIASFKRHRR